MKRIVLLILITFFARESYAHKSSPIDSIVKNTELDFRFSHAFIIHHHHEMRIYREHFSMLEFSLQKQTYGRQTWQRYYNYPTIGVSVLYSCIGNHDVFGSAYAIYPFINFPFNKSIINSFNFRLGIGPGYLTKKFDQTENPNNIYIGSHINATISLSFEYKRQISNHLKISLFAGLTHFSNGCSYQPNNGINIFNTGLSTTYLIGNRNSYKDLTKLMTYNKEEIKQINSLLSKKIDLEFYLGLSYGFKRVEYKQKDNFSVYNFEFYAMERVSNLSKFGIGIDLIYDETDVLVLDINENKYNFAQLLKPGIGVAYELIIGDMSFLFNMGFHPWGLDMSYGRIYNKLALKANIGEYFYGKVTLNTHFGVADFVGFGLGIRLQ